MFMFLRQWITIKIAIPKNPKDRQGYVNIFFICLIGYNPRIYMHATDICKHFISHLICELLKRSSEGNVCIKEH